VDRDKRLVLVTGHRRERGAIELVGTEHENILRRAHAVLDDADLGGAWRWHQILTAMDARPSAYARPYWPTVN
jgi:hypothetical protein